MRARSRPRPPASRSIGQRTSSAMEAERAELIRAPARGRAALWMRTARALQPARACAVSAPAARCELGELAAGTLRGASAAREEAGVGKNILIFSDGTGQAGGYMPDEARSNVYKLFRATRVGPESIIDPELQLAFYDGGLGSRAETIKITPLRRLYNLLSRATGLGITQNIIDCYAHIIRVWQPGDRIYLFGFSRGAYTVRCVGGVLKYCGIPTAVREKGGGVRPLQRDARSARRIATEAVKHVYQHGGSIRGDPLRLERERRAARFRHKYFSGRRQGLQHGALLHRRVGDGADAGGGNAWPCDAGAPLRGDLRWPRPCFIRGGWRWLLAAVPAARCRAAGGDLCRGLHALQGAGEPAPLSPGLLRHAAQSCRALCPARAGDRREPRAASPACRGTRSVHASPSPISPTRRRASGRYGSPAAIPTSAAAIPRRRRGSPTSRWCGWCRRC